MVTCSYQLHGILCIFAIFAHMTVGQDVMSELRIQPEDDRGIVEGSSILLTCSYEDHITDVAWVNPDGDVITEDTMIPILERDNGALYLQFTDVKTSVSGRYKCAGMSTRINETIEVTKIVTVYTPIKYRNTPEVQKFELGRDAVVVCKVTGNPPADVSWKRGDEKIETTNTSNRIYIDENKISKNLVIKNLQESDEGDFVCVARESTQGQIDERVIFVDVQFPPAGIKVSENMIGVKGRKVTLTCSASADPEPTYAWYRGNGVEFNDSNLITEGLEINGTTLVLENVQESDGGDYTCLVTNERGRDSNTTTLIVHVPPMITNATDQTVKNGSNAVIKCMATGIPTPEVTFYRNDKRVNQSDQISDVTPVVAEYGDNYGTVIFEPARSSDDGEYECRAVNAAGTASEIVMLNVLYGPMNETFPTVYGCIGRDATLTCKFEANPTPELAWGKMEEIPALPGFIVEMFGNSTTTQQSRVGFVPVNTTRMEGDQLLLQISDVTEESYGVYHCEGTNSEGQAYGSVQFQRASPPRAPINVMVSGVSTKKASLTFSPPKVVPVDITRYQIMLKGGESTKKFRLEPDLTDSTSNDLLFTLTELEHNTNYSVTVQAENCEGLSAESDEQTFSTRAIENPGRVLVKSPKMANAHDNYTIQWTEGDSGGGTLQEVVIKYQPISIDSNATDPGDVEVVTITNHEPAFINKAYQLTNLRAATSYEGTITVYNEVGGSMSEFQFQTQPGDNSHIFKLDDTDVSGSEKEVQVVKVTPRSKGGRKFPNFNISSLLKVPTELPPTEDDDDVDKDLSAGGISGMIIGLIVAGFILLLIIIDLSCCISRSCGVFHFIYVHTCAPSGAAKEQIKDAEEGSAEYRKDNKVDEVTNVVTSNEKQPLADDPEPIANGTEQEGGVVNEETPLNNDQSNGANGDTSTNEVEQENAKEKTPLSPDDVKMDVHEADKVQAE